MLKPRSTGYHEIVIVNLSNKKKELLFYTLTAGWFTFN